MLWNSLPQNIADACVDAKLIQKLMEQKYIGVFYTKWYHLWLRRHLSLKLLTAGGVCDGELSPIAFPFSNTFLGCLSEVKYWDRQMFDLAKYNHYYIPIDLVA